MRRPAPASLVVIVLLAAAPALADEVRHDGKTPAEWAEVLASGEKRFRHPAAEALTQHLEGYAASAIPTLVRALESEVGEVRHLAAKCLGTLGEAARGEPAAGVAALLEDEEGHVRCAAANALGAIGDSRHAGVLRAALEAADPELRACAAHGLGSLGEGAREAVPDLRSRLQDESVEVRAAAGLALLGITGEVGASREAILRALRPPAGPTSRAQVHLRERVIRALGDIGVPAAEFAPALAEIVEKDRSFARDFAAAALARLGTAGEVGIPALVAGLADSTFRQAAAQALAGFGPVAAPAVPGLVDLLKRPTWKEESAVAARALGRIGPKAADAVPALVDALDPGDATRSEAVLIALGDLGETASAAVLAIRPLVTSESQVLRLAAVRALHRITGEGGEVALATLLAGLKSDDERERSVAARLLGSLGTTNDSVRETLRAVEGGDGSAEVRRSAAASLRALRP